uniref:Uncharacterized protein n=1 Tax=Panagrolaimus sp. ES5 TaxID=591445 RepID=A0AC34F6C4_9BILA
MSKNSSVKKLKNDIKESLKEKNHEHAFHRTIKLASHLKDDGKYQEALKEYENAKMFVKRCRFEDRNGFDYIADKGYIETIFEKGDDNEAILDHLQKFLEKYKNENNFPPKINQEMCYFTAWSYSYLNKFDEARSYAVKSLELLNKFQTKDSEYELCKASTYRILADVSLDENKNNDAKNYCEKALKCKGIKSDIQLYYSLLNIKRHYVKREDRLAISLEMVEIFNGRKNLLKNKKFNTYICLLEDYFIQKDLENAKEAYFVLYKDPECLKNDIKNEVKAGLVVLYEWKKRMQFIHQLKVAPEVDYKKIALIYERCCHELKNLSVLEILIQYYEIILNICKFIDGDKIYGDIDIFCRTLASLIEAYYDLGTYNRLWGHEFIELHEKAVFYATLLYDVQKRVGASKNVLLKIQLNRAIKQVYCNINFEQKRKAFTDVKQFLTDDLQQVQWYTNYITLLENNPEYMQNENVVELKIQLKDYQDKIKEINMESPCSQLNYTDEYDELSQDGILKCINEDIKTFDEIEKLKNKKKQIKPSGETYLHIAVLNASPEHVKLLFEKCGYSSIINSTDNIGLTPLHHAVLYSKYETAECLLQNHAEVNTATTTQFRPIDSGIVLPSTTPLMEACSQGNAKLIKLLLQYKADPLMKDSEGKNSVRYLENAIPHVDESRRSDLIEILNSLTK